MARAGVEYPLIPAGAAIVRSRFRHRRAPGSRGTRDRRRAERSVAGDPLRAPHSQRRAWRRWRSIAPGPTMRPRPSPSRRPRGDRKGRGRAPPALVPAALRKATRSAHVRRTRCDALPALLGGVGSQTTARRRPAPGAALAAVPERLRSDHAPVTRRRETPARRGCERAPRRGTHAATTVTVGLLAATLMGGPVAAQVRLDPELPPYRAVGGVSGALTSVGSGTLDNLMTLWGDLPEGLPEHASPDRGRGLVHGPAGPHRGHGPARAHVARHEGQRGGPVREALRLQAHAAPRRRRRPGRVRSPGTTRSGA